MKPQQQTDFGKSLDIDFRKKASGDQEVRTQERFLHDVFSLFAYDRLWKVLYGEYNGLCLLFWLRPKLQPLAKKYRGRPRELTRALEQLLDATAKKLGIPESELRSFDDLFRPTQRLSRRQHKTINRLTTEFLPSLFSPDGKPHVPSNPTLLVKMFTGLTSNPPGPKPSKATQKIQKLHLKGMRPARIARKVYNPEYEHADSIRKQELIAEVRTVIKNMRRSESSLS